MPRRLPLRRSHRRPKTARRIPRRLRQAHRLLAAGKHRQAATLFLELARRAEDLRLVRAPLLYLQAGRALVLANEVEAGGRQLKQALTLLAEQGQPQRLHSIANRISVELSRLGHDQLAADIRQHVEQWLGTQAAVAQDGAQRRQLPAKCEQCGANLHPDEVEILSDNSLACAYCGSRVVAKEGPA